MAAILEAAIASTFTDDEMQSKGKGTDAGKAQGKDNSTTIKGMGKGKGAIKGKGPYTLKGKSAGKGKDTINGTDTSKGKGQEQGHEQGQDSNTVTDDDSENLLPPFQWGFYQ
eukprot:5353024-Heterocapsa_arctica.AAC.1